MTAPPHIAGPCCLRCEDLLWAVWKLCEPVHQSGQSFPYCLGSDLPQHSCAITGCARQSHCQSQTLCGFCQLCACYQFIPCGGSGPRSCHDIWLGPKFNCAAHHRPEHSLTTWNAPHNEIERSKKSAKRAYILGFPQIYSHMLTWSCHL